MIPQVNEELIHEDSTAQEESSTADIDFERQGPKTRSVGTNTTEFNFMFKNVQFDNIPFSETFFLSYIFFISVDLSTVSRIFHNWINVMDKRFESTYHLAR